MHGWHCGCDRCRCFQQWHLVCWIAVLLSEGSSVVGQLFVQGHLVSNGSGPQHCNIAAQGMSASTHPARSHGRGVTQITGQKYLARNLSAAELAHVANQSNTRSHAFWKSTRAGDTMHAGRKTHQDTAMSLLLPAAPIIVHGGKLQMRRQQWPWPHCTSVRHQPLRPL